MIIGESFVEVRPETSAFASDAEGMLSRAFSGFTAPLAVTAAIGTAVAGTLFAVGETFDTAFDKIRVATGATGDALSGLQGTFKQVVSDIPTDFGEAGDAVSALAQKLQLTGDPLRDLSERVLRLSDLTKTDLKTNIQETADVMNSWGVAAADQAGKLDELFRASQATGASVSSIQSAMASGGPLFRQIGFDFEQSAAFVGLFAKAGVDVNSALQPMSRAIAEAAKQGKSASDVFRDTFDAIRNAPNDTAAAGAAVDVFGARAGPRLAGLIREGKLSYEELAKAISSGGDSILQAGKDTDDLGEKMRLVFNKIMVAIEPAASAVFDFAGLLADQLAVAVDAVVGGVKDFVSGFSQGTDALGSAQSVWAVFGATVFEAWDAFRNAFSGEGITSDGWVGTVEHIGVAVRAVVDNIVNGFAGFRAALSGEGVTSDGFVGVMERIGVAVRWVIDAVVGLAEFYGPRLADMWASIQPAIETVASFIGDHLNVVLAAAGIAIGLLVAPVASAVAAFLYFYANSETFRNAVDGIASVLRSVGEWVAEHWKPIVATLATIAILADPFAFFIALVAGFVALYTKVDAFRHAVDGLVSAFRVVFTNVASGLAGFAAFFMERWERIRDAVVNVVKGIGIAIAIVLAPIIFVWTHFHDQIMAVVTLVWNQVVNVIQTAFRIIGDIFDVVINLLTGNWGDAWDAIKDIFGAAFDYLHDSLGNLLTFVIEFFSSLPGNMLDALGDLGGLLFDVGISVLTGLLDGLASMLEALGNWFLGLPGQILGWLGDVATWLLDVGPKAIGGFLVGLGTAELGLLDWWIHLPGRILGWLGDAVSWLWQKGWDAIVGIVNGLHDSEWQVINWFTELPGRIVLWVTSNVGRIGELGFTLIDKLWHAVTDEVWRIIGLASDIVGGLIEGFNRAWPAILSWVKDKAGDLIHAFTHPWEIRSPSRVTFRMGTNIMEGLALGLQSAGDKPLAALEAVNRALLARPAQAKMATILPFDPRAPLPSGTDLARVLGLPTSRGYQGALPPAPTFATGASAAPSATDLTMTNDLLRDVCSLLRDGPTVAVLEPGEKPAPGATVKKLRTKKERQLVA